jgi:hypothetical protein
MRLFNKIPVLDKGFVANLSVHLNDKDLEFILVDHLAGQFQPKVLEMANATILVKCPLFVQLWLGTAGLTTIPTRQSIALEAYKPNLSDIGSGNLELDKDISEDIAQTTDALLINPKAYVHDGCEKFVSQITTPISVYNELVVSGNMLTWINLITADKLPKLIEPYRYAIREVLLTEWKKLPEYEEQLIQWLNKRSGKSKS